ncbi:glycosyltransferase family 4 protein [Marinifilum caeruleilacunae]|uniref:Glycosyltransferase n=1 Tax=Marinifilum caeruleilacunae TaxID=2499076 RepID=A0ABX1WW75_9BACT|nr:glycosyltransferase family 4 protein [Marinifilum caeruleilacunae]NOU60370.1 glycosyltransferase [Marinifilum caeruleilacunae]
MRIALCHFRVGETDGVSLEMDKWKKALEQLGHEVIYIAGSSGNCEAELVPALHYQHPVNNRIVANAYQSLSDYENESQLEKEIYDLAKEIENDLVRIISEQQIDVIVPNNVLSLGWGLSAGIAFHAAIEKTGVKAICHHHDFHWERELYSNPKVSFVNDLLDKHFPPVSNQVKHVCINHIAKIELKNRYGLEAVVVPNVFEFEQELIAIDDYNADLRKEFGIKSNDIVFMQATRVVERKAIEIAIDLLSEVQKKKEKLLGNRLYHNDIINNDTEFYLVFAGQNESEHYYQNLIDYSVQKGVKVIDISNRVNHERKLVDGKKVYSLWDAYSIADIVTYPSILEGWGNQFLEALVAKLPIATYKYPVYLTDIEQFGFHIIALGSEYSKAENLVEVDQSIIQTAADESIKYLVDKEYRREKTEENYRIAKQNLSIDSLRGMLKEIFIDGTI